MTARDARVAAVANRYVAARQYAGIEWLVEKDGKVLTRGGTGVADAATGAPLTERPLYRIYSMTKPIVSVLGLMLIEQGKLRLYDLLAQFDKRFAAPRVLHAAGKLEPANRPITVEDLFTHRAGFTYEFIHGCHVAPYYRAAAIASDGSCSLDEMMGRVAQQPLAFHPGSQYRYSVATDALAHVIERAADRPIDELLRTQIFEPLGMRDTAYRVAPSERGRLLPMHGVADITQLPALDLTPHTLERVDAEGMYPSDRNDFRRGGHGLFSTMDDYAAFARMLLTGKSASGETLLSRPMLAMLRANRLTPAQLPLTIGLQTLPGYGWGLGVRVLLDAGAATSLSNVGEHGWAGAASTFYWVDPAESMIGLVMTQYLGSALPLADDMRTAAYQMLV